MNKYIFLLLAIFLLAIPMVSAIPTVPTVSSITANGATFDSTGASGNAWFNYGLLTIPEWRTGNITPTGGAITAQTYSAEFTAEEQYYVRACDSSGCSATASFTTTHVVPFNPPKDLQAPLNTIMASHYNVMTVLSQMPVPYMGLMPNDWITNGAGICFLAGMFFGFYFIGLWMRNRSTVVAIILGLIVVAYLVTSGSSFGWGIPDEVSMIAQLAVYAGIAGAIVSMFKK